MHEHTCSDGCAHSPAQIARTLDDALRMIAVFSLYCSRGSLEQEIDDAWERAPGPKKKSARKAAILATQEEFWTIQESFKKASSNLPARLHAQFTRAMRELLGGWYVEDLELIETCQELLGTLLWAIGAIDALPPLSAGFEPETTAEAISQINAGTRAPVMRDLETFLRTEKELRVLAARDDEWLAVTRSRHAPEPQTLTEDEVLTQARAKTLTAAAEANWPVQDGDIVVEGAPYGTLSNEDEERIALNALARGQVMQWMFGEYEFAL